MLGLNNFTLITSKRVLCVMRYLLLWIDTIWIKIYLTQHRSRSPSGSLEREGKLHPAVVAQTQDRFGRTELDLFASRENAQYLLVSSMTDSNAPLRGWMCRHAHGSTCSRVCFPPVEMILPGEGDYWKAYAGRACICMLTCWWQRVVAMVQSTRASSTRDL